jgi:hypothetical protein
MTAKIQTSHPHVAAQPGAPGPFAFADGDWLRRLLTNAGYAGIDLRTIRRSCSEAFGISRAPSR